MMMMMMMMMMKENKKKEQITAAATTTITRTKRKLEKVSIAKVLQLEAARRRAVPIRFNTSPWQVWTRSGYPLPSYSVFTVDTPRWTLTPWPWPLTFDLEHMQWTGFATVKLCRNLSSIGQSAVELLQFEYLTLWRWTCITCCATLTIVYTMFKLSQAIRSWNVTVFRLIRYATLWPWPLTPWPCMFDVKRVWHDETLYKSERNRTIRGRVIDDIAHLRRSVLGAGGWALSPDGSQGCVDLTSSNLL